MPQLPESTALEMKRTYDAVPSEVFDAWMNREEWQSWIGPEGVTCEVALLEPRVGGRYRVIMHPPDGRTLTVTGVFQEIEPPKVLAFTWVWDGEGRGTRVSVRLRDLGGRTELTLRHEGFDSVAERDEHREGWSSALGKLAGYLPGRQSELRARGSSEHSPRAST